MALQIRPMTPADFASADTLLISAFKHGGSYAEELPRFHALQPDGLLLATLGGEPAGTGSMIDYGGLAWIGLMAVAPDFQRHGIATTLLRDLLDRLCALACPLALLDASPAGAPLYLRHGFVDYDEAVRYISSSGTAPVGQVADTVMVLMPEDTEEMMAFDRAIFGADRHAMLALLLAAHPGRTFVSRDADGRIDGYLLAQPRRIGPWLAVTDAAAEALLAAARTLPYTEPPHVIGPAANPTLGALLADHGFGEQRRLRHMGRGDGPHPSRRGSIYGQASFSLG